MKTKRLFLTALLSMAALFVTCSIAFASSAVVDEGGYTHPPQFGNTIVLDGVDVSVYQADIDWEKVKRQGIDFAYIRIGHAWFDSPHRPTIDSYFEQNYRNAREAGVMVGVYFYSTATTMKEAQAEAKFVLDTMNGRKLDLPVAYDFEMPSDSRLTKAYYNWKASERKAKAASNSLAFLNYIEKNSDYDAMFYSYRSITSPYLNPGGSKIDMDLIDQKYRVWLAQYSSDNSYERPYDTWQYTSSGRVTGISGNTDCNFWYFDPHEDLPIVGTTDINNASVSLSKTSYEYTKFKKQPLITATLGGKTLKKGTDYDYYYLKNVLAGTGYAMLKGKGDYSGTKLVPFTITTTDIADGGTISDISDQTYSGSAKKPSVKVMYKNTTFKKDVDYTVSYSNNTNAGTATVKITGKRNFHGSMTKTFKIKKATPKFTGYTTYFRTPSREDFKINTKSSNKEAKLTYKSSDTGIATVDENGTISLTGGIGTAVITVTSPETKNYNQAVRNVNIKVTPDEEEPETPDVPETPEEPDEPENSGLIAGVENTTLKASSQLGDKFIRIEWEKSPGYKMDYYEVFRSTVSGDYGDDPYFTTKDGTSTYYKNTGGLKAGTRYYYKVRGVREIDGKLYYSKWSNQAYRLYPGSAEEDKNQKLIDGVEATTLKASSVLGKTYIQVKWKKSPGYKMDCYQVFRTTKSGEYDEDEPYFTTKDGTKTSYKNTKDLKKGTRYYYKVRGVRKIDGKTYYSQWSKQAYRLFK